MIPSKTSTWDRWKERARSLKGLVYALYFAYRDPRTPLIARIVAACIVAYAFSPIDLIPDPIPVLGYLDDLILIPLGVALAIKLMPDEVWTDSMARSKNAMVEGARPGRIAATVIIAIWLTLAVAGAYVLKTSIW